VIEKSDSFLVEAAGGEQKLAARKRACGGTEANNNRRITARYGVTVSMPQAYCTGCYGGGYYAIWRDFMMVIILDLLIELQMSVIMLIIEGVDSGRGSIQGLMHTRER
jgi:hypothetical protein